MTAKTKTKKAAKPKAKTKKAAKPKPKEELSVESLREGFERGDTQIGLRITSSQKTDLIRRAKAAGAHSLSRYVISVLWPE